MDLNEFIKVYSEKLGYSEEEIKKEYEGLLSNENKIHPMLNDDQKQTRAIQRLGMLYKRLMRSPAVVFEGVVLGKTDIINTMARRIREAKQAFANNPTDAVAKNLTNEDGVPLDNLKTYSTGRANPNFGKTLPEERLLQTVYGVASTKDGETKKFILTLNDKHTGLNIPKMKPVKFRALNRTKEGDAAYILGGSALTKFEETVIEGMPTVNNIIDQCMKEHKCAIKDISEWHNQHKMDYSRLAIIEGDVVTLQTEPNAVTGNRLMVISDDPANFESKDLLCWIPEHIDIDFSEQSKVIVIGSTGEMKKRLDDGSYSDTEKDNCLNVYGIWAIPEYKINPEIEDLEPEHINGKNGDSKKTEEGGW